MGGEDVVVKIRVGQFSVGIVGLKAAFEAAAMADISSDDEAAEYLLERLRGKNYISPRAEPEYAQAFLREYKKHRGEPVETEKAQGLEIKVLGAGCPNCDKLEQMVYQVMETERIIGSVEHVRDLKEIATYGLLATPALVINGEVRCSGRLPRMPQLLQWLRKVAVART